MKYTRAGRAEIVIFAHFVCKFALFFAAVAVIIRELWHRQREPQQQRRKLRLSLVE